MRRTTRRNVKDTKFNAARDKRGRFAEVKTPKGTQAADLRRKNKAEAVKTPK